MGQAGAITLRDSIFGVGPTFKRITGTAKGDSIKIMQEEADVTVVKGNQGDATFIITEDNVRRIELLLIPSTQDITLLMALRKLGLPFPFSFEFGITKLQGLWAIEKDCDIVVSDAGTPVTIAGPAWAGNKLIGAQGVILSG